jgi:S1-C subfamily serine protease
MYGWLSWRRACRAGARAAPAGGAPRRHDGAALAALVGAGALPAVVAPALAQNPPPASAGLGNVRVEEGYADLAAAVMPAVVNVRVERSAAGEAQAQGPMDDPEMRRFFERFFGAPPRARAGPVRAGPGQGGRTRAG